MANQQNLSRRAALRQQQDQEQRQKRVNRIIGVGAGILAVVLLAVIAIVAIPPLLESTNTKIEVTEEQLTPPSATADHGIALDGKQPADGIPHVVIYSDYRCPACKTNDEYYGPIYQQLSDEGKITVEFQTTYFQDGDDPDNSYRASIAAATADAVGKYKEYKRVLFDNQAATFSEKQLRDDFAKQAGIEGADLKKFQELLRTRAYQEFAERSHQSFIDRRIPGTPTYAVGERRLVFGNSDTGETYIDPTPDALYGAIVKAHEGTEDPSNEPLVS